jgi:hypothetical protein
VSIIAKISDRLQKERTLYRAHIFSDEKLHFLDYRRNTRKKPKKRGIFTELTSLVPQNCICWIIAKIFDRWQKEKTLYRAHIFSAAKLHSLDHCKNIYDRWQKERNLYWAHILSSAKLQLLDYSKSIRKIAKREDSVQSWNL